MGLPVNKQFISSSRFSEEWGFLSQNNSFHIKIQRGMGVPGNNGHRAKYIKYGKQLANGVEVNLSDLDDEYSLGIHLHDVHNITDADGFDKYYRFTILESCNPRDLSKKEHLWIQKLRTLFPHGLNQKSPFGLPLLTNE